MVSVWSYLDQSLFTCSHIPGSYLTSSTAHFCKLRPYDILPYINVALFYGNPESDLNGFDNNHNFRLI